MEGERIPLTLIPHPLTQGPGVGKERSCLKSLVKMISATVDTWSKENAHLFQDGTLALTDKAKLLCDKFSAKGTETIVVGVNISDGTAFQLGSKHGLDFLNSRFEILSDFFKFSKENTLKINTGEGYQRVATHHGAEGSNVSSGITQTGVLPSRIEERGVSGVGNLATQGILHSGQTERSNKEPSTISMASVDSAHKNAVSTVSSEAPLHIVSIQKVKEEPLPDEEDVCTGTDDTEVQQESVSVKTEEVEACTGQLSNSGDAQAVSHVMSASQSVNTASVNKSNGISNVVPENRISGTGDSNSACGHPSNVSTPLVTCQLVPVSMKYLIVPTSTSSEGAVPTSTSSEGAVPTSTSSEGVAPTSTSSEGVVQQSGPKLSASRALLAGMISGDENSRICATSQQSDKEIDEVSKRSGGHRESLDARQRGLIGKRKATEEDESSATKLRKEPVNQMAVGSLNEVPPYPVIPPNEMPSISSTNYQENTCRVNVEASREPISRRAKKRINWAKRLQESNFIGEPADEHHLFDEDESYKPSSSEAESVEGSDLDTEVSSVEENNKCHSDQTGIQGLPHPKTTPLSASKGQWESTSQQRFKKVTEEEILGLESVSQSESTKNNTKWGVAIFQEWHTETYGSKVDFRSMSRLNIAEKLRIFYCEARPKNIGQRSKSMTLRHATEYHISSLKCIRAALNRHLHDIDSDIDIVRDKEFTRANRALQGTIKNKRKQEMEYPTEHKLVITTPDLVKISTYLKNGYQTSPIVLRQAMWFTVSFHFATRGMDFHHQLRRNCFEIRCDENGDTFATLSKEALRDCFQGGHDNREKPTDCRMCAVPESDLCPLKLLNFYLNRLHPASTHFYNHYDKEALGSPRTAASWYNATPLTKYSFSYFMRDLGKAAGCGEKYTPQCLRATAMQSMKDTGHEIRHLVFMTGDR